MIQDYDLIRGLPNNPKLFQGEIADPALSTEPSRLNVIATGAHWPVTNCPAKGAHLTPLLRQWEFGTGPRKGGD